MDELREFLQLDHVCGLHLVQGSEKSCMEILEWKRGSVVATIGLPGPDSDVLVWDALHGLPVLLMTPNLNCWGDMTLFAKI